MTTPLTILPLLIVRPKLLLRSIQSMRTVPTTLNSLGTCVFLTTNVPMDCIDYTEQFGYMCVPYYQCSNGTL